MSCRITKMDVQDNDLNNYPDLNNNTMSTFLNVSTYFAFKRVIFFKVDVNFFISKVTLITFCLLK